MAASSTQEQKSKLSRACPWCGQSIEGRAFGGLCHKCGKAYEAWMLGPVPRKVVPRWIWLAPVLYGIISIAGLYVYGLASGGTNSAELLAFVALMGMVPSLILLYIVTLAFCAARHWRGASVVTFFGLASSALGGPGFLIALYIGYGNADVQMLAPAIILQPVATFAALVFGSVAAVFIPRDKSRASKSTRNVTSKQRRAWIAKRLARERAARLHKAREPSHRSQAAPGPKAEPDEHAPH